MRDPGLAAVLSAIIPGVRQFYNGRVLAGILLLIITPRLWIAIIPLGGCAPSVVCWTHRTGAMGTKKDRVMGGNAAPDVVRAGPPDLREGG